MRNCQGNIILPIICAFGISCFHYRDLNLVFLPGWQNLYLTWGAPPCPGGGIACCCGAYTYSKQNIIIINNNTQLPKDHLLSFLASGIIRIWLYREQDCMSIWDSQKEDQSWVLGCWLLFTNKKSPLSRTDHLQFAFLLCHLRLREQLSAPIWQVSKAHGTSRGRNHSSLLHHDGLNIKQTMWRCYSDCVAVKLIILYHCFFHHLLQTAQQ